MTNSAPLPFRIVTLSVVLLIVCLLSCQQSQPTSPATSASPSSVPQAAQVAAAEKVFVVFEGPWALAPDPKDASKILAIAPKTKSHRDLYVAASKRATLAAGVFDLSLPVSGGTGAPSIDPDILQAKTTAADLQRALDAKSVRYVIRLPKPEAYLASTKVRSRIGPAYPAAASEKEYVSAVSLRYSVSALNGFSLSGTPDSGSFNPQLLEVGNPAMVSFMIDALPEDEPCHGHSREAFRDLTGLLNLTLFVDFPDSPATCRDADPQKAKAGRTGAATYTSRDLLGTILFFGHVVTDCHAPAILLSLN